MVEASNRLEVGDTRELYFNFGTRRQWQVKLTIIHANLGSTNPGRAVKS
jgi:hypothetical protein